MSEERVVVLTTVANAEDAERLARLLVDSRLAACVNVLPGVASVYRWKGCVLQESEVLLLVKTRRDALDALREALVAAHPSEVPELVTLPIVAGHEPYLAWLDENVGPRRDG